MLDVCKVDISNYSTSYVAKLFFSYSLGYLYIVDNMDLSNVFYYNYSVRDYFRGVKILDVDNNGVANVSCLTYGNCDNEKRLLTTRVEKLFNLISN